MGILAAVRGSALCMSMISVYFCTLSYHHLQTLKLNEVSYLRLCFWWPGAWSHSVLAAGPCDLSCLDLFSASAKLAKSFRAASYRSANYDIQTGGWEADISTRTGFSRLLCLGLRLLGASLIMCGPPCSMFIWMSCSQHKRHIYGARGFPGDKMTQLANCIADNMAP